jgi:hypothetical protein
MAADTPEPRIDYTDINHHQDIPNSADTGDPSRPQGPFWHPEERDRARRFLSIDIEAGRVRTDVAPPAAVGHPRDET